MSHHSTYALSNKSDQAEGTQMPTVNPLGALLALIICQSAVAGLPDCRASRLLGTGMTGLAATGAGAASPAAGFGLKVAGVYAITQAITGTPTLAQTAGGASAAGIGTGGLTVGPGSAIGTVGPADHLSGADIIGLLSAIVAAIALGLSFAVYMWSRSDLEKCTKSIEEGIRRWSETTIQIQATVGQIEQAIASLSRESFSLVKDHIIRGVPGTGVAEREAVRTDTLVNHIQTQGSSAIEEVLKGQGVPANIAPALKSQLSVVFADSLKKTRAATELARDDTLREEMLRALRDHDDTGLTLSQIEDLLSASYSRSDIASAIESLKSAGGLHLTPDKFDPAAVARIRRIS